MSPHSELCVHVKDKFFCNNLYSKILCKICYNQGHHVSCKILHELHTCQAAVDADDSNSRVIYVTFSLPLRETSSRLCLCITCRQCDHVIAPHSIVSLAMRGESGASYSQLHRAIHRISTHCSVA